MNNNLELIYWTNNGGVELPLEDWQFEQPRPTSRTRIPLQPSGFLISDWFWNRDFVQHYAFPDSSDIFRCFVRQKRDCSIAVHPPPHCIIQLIHIQKVVTKEQGFQLQIYIVIRLL